MHTSHWTVPLLLAVVATAHAADGTFETRSLTPETALAAARAAQDACRKQGYQVAVAVSDRAGTPQVLLRDRYAGPHTIEVATDKAWTAASFRTSTAALAVDTQAGRPMSGLRNIPRFLAVGGGRPIEAGEACWAPSAFPADRAARPTMRAPQRASRPSSTRSNSKEPASAVCTVRAALLI